MVIQSTATAQSKAASGTVTWRGLRPWSAIALVLLMAQLTACASPGYYAQAASGQWELMRQRQDIADLLASESTEPQLARRLELARSAQAFGVETLGLPEDSQYRQYVQTGREAVSWNVVAAPEFSLKAKTWCFLVAGCVPYRGYFKEGKAQSFAGRLQRRGYDVAVMPATAYSTLGWFEDPLLDTMFAAGDTHLAGTIFHEMAHRQLYVKGDTVFNESFATFVEQTGVRLWLASRDEDAAYADWQADRQRRQAVDETVMHHRGELDRLYASDRAPEEMREAKRRILDSLCRDIANSRNGKAGECRINNASLALRDSYLGGVCAFENLYRETGEDMTAFLERAGAMAETSAEHRRNWLAQRCSPVAPEGNL